MNISELARKLRVNPNQLREMLPQMGFDIGGKAIKIDNRTAHRIMKDWRKLFLRWQLEYRKPEEEEEKKVIAPEDRQDVYIPKLITVKEFAAKIDTPVNVLMKALMKSGILASLNDNIDFESAAIIGDDLGWKVLLQEGEGVNLDTESEEIIEEVVKSNKNTESRAPIIVVMGHVDHGKTKILDAIRKTNVIEGESGGITQHIGAYEVKKNNRQITFIDTPGHEAFTAMRSRGAKVADIAIVVVAADDGIQPQTREVIDIVNAAKLPFVVAINKMDKPEADPERVKRELSELNLMAEDWGGKTITVPVSAMTGDGIDGLLETILLVADMEAKNIVADSKGETVASVIESNVDKNTGVVSTLLIQNGTLRVNDYLKLGNVLYGRVRSMENWKGEKIKEAGPSVPVRILGLKLAPEVGDVLSATDSIKGLERSSRKITTQRATTPSIDSVAEEAGDKEIVNILLKTDVLGSAEAIIGSLEQFRHPKLAIKVIHNGLGNITEADIERADASRATIYGFHVRVDSQIEELARDKEVNIKMYEIIYDLLDSVKDRLEKELSQEMERIDLGKLKVLAIFKRNKKEQIIGGKVLEGRALNNAKFDLMRQNVKIETGEIMVLQAGKQDVTEVESPNECGMKVVVRQEINEGDILLIYREERKEQKVEL